MEKREVARGTLTGSPLVVSAAEAGIAAIVTPDMYTDDEDFSEAVAVLGDLGALANAKSSASP